MKKIISYCLYGKNPFYTYGMIENVIACKKLYPDFKCRVYYRSCVPEKIINTLKTFDNCELYFIDDTHEYGGMLDRSRPFFDDDVEIFLSRDADSRLTAREVEIYNKWNKSNTAFMTLYEAGGRGEIVIDGGMFACNNKLLGKHNQHKIKEHFNTYIKKYKWKSRDRPFLNNYIFPLIRNNISAYANFKVFAKYHEKVTAPYLKKLGINVEQINTVNKLIANKYLIGAYNNDIDNACKMFNEEKFYVAKRYK